MKNLYKIAASAGSGKTYSLTRRYLKLLAGSEMTVHAHCRPPVTDKHYYNFSEILAVTFTNLAADQMQKRIIKSLKRIALGHNPDGDNWQEEEAKNALTQIFRKYSALNIKTIDSLLHHLVRISALELEISPEFDVTFDEGQVISPLFDSLAWQALEEEAYQELFYAVCDAIITYRPDFTKFLAGDFLKKQCIKMVYALICADMSAPHSLQKNTKERTGRCALDDLAESYQKHSVLSLQQRDLKSTPQNITDVSAETPSDVSGDDVFGDVLTKVSADVFTDVSADIPTLDMATLEQELESFGFSLEDLKNYHNTLHSIDYFSEKEVRQQDTSLTSPEELHAILTEVKGHLQDTAKTMLQLIDKHALSADARFRSILSYLMENEYKFSTYLTKESLRECLNKASKDVECDDAYTHYNALKVAAQEAAGLGIILSKALQQAPMLELARHVQEKVWKQEKEQGMLLSARMPSLVAKILRNELAVSGAFCRMGSRLTHILLDEFQDTSHEQWNALEPLAGGALADGGSVFFVGDVKQAIYGWRGGDAELFNSAPNALRSKALGFEDTPLAFNWRSEAYIIEWNNAFFKGLATVDVVEVALSLVLNKSLSEKYQSGNDAALTTACRHCAEKIRNIYAQAVQELPSKRHEQPKIGLVQTHFVNVPKTKGKLAILSLLPGCVRSLHERHEWQDICVLTVTNEQARLVSEVLLSQGIPVVSQGSLLMMEHPMVIELTALMRFLSNPLDDLAFWQVLVSKHILPVNLYEVPLFDFLVSKRKEPLFIAFKNRFTKLWELYFQPLLDGAGLMTAYDTLCEIYSRWDLRERHKDADVFLLRFLEIVHLAEENSLMDLGSFLGWWETHAHNEQAPLPKNTGAVSVMTVHKAKGLEFDAVLMPWHDFKIEPDKETPQILEYSYKERPIRLFSSLMPEHGKPYYEAFYDKMLESINTLYVAWTRPVKELHIFKVPDDEKPFSKFLDYMLTSFQTGDSATINTATTKSEITDNAITDTQFSCVLEESADYMSFGRLAEQDKKTGEENHSQEIMDTKAPALIYDKCLRFLEYRLCVGDEKFVQIYNDAEACIALDAGIGHIVGFTEEDIESIQQSDILYMAKKMAEALRKLEEKYKVGAQTLFEPAPKSMEISGKNHGKEQADSLPNSLPDSLPDSRINNRSNDLTNSSANSLSDISNTHRDAVQTDDLITPKAMQILADKCPQSPMAWLPRLQVFRSNLAELQQHAVLSSNKRGTLMHKCLGRIVYSGDIASDVKRALKDGIGYTAPMELAEQVVGAQETESVQRSQKQQIHTHEISGQGMTRQVPTRQVPNRQVLSHLALNNEDIERFTQALTWFLSLEGPYGGAKEWLRYGLKEHALASKEGQIFRVDLLVNRPQFLLSLTDDGSDPVQLVAIDYKTGYMGELPDKKNVEQIQNYLQLLHESTQGTCGRGKVLGILIYLDRQEICLIPYTPQ